MHWELPFASSSRWVSYSPPKIEIVPWCLSELDLSVPWVKVGGNYVQSHPNTCNCIVDLRLTPQLKGEKENWESNIGKQSQYLTNDHPNAARLSDLVQRLQIHQPVLLCRFQPPPTVIIVTAYTPPPPAATKYALTKIWHNCRCCFMAAVTPKSISFCKKNNLDIREHLGSPLVSYIAPELSRGCVPSIQSADTRLG